jgi:hypothetical protein
MKAAFNLFSFLCLFCAQQGRAQAPPAALPYLLFSPYQPHESLTYHDGVAVEEIRADGIDVEVTEPAVVADSSIVCLKLMVHNEGITPFDINPFWISALASINGNRTLDFMAPDRSAKELNELGLSARIPLEANTLAPGESTAAMSVGLGLLLWAWFALTLPPIQRYYFAAYVDSSLHIAGSEESDRAEWILKTRPKDKVEIVDPQDLVPTAHGALPFALSKSAQAQGWTGTDSTVPIAYPAGSQRLFLRQNFFEGRSLLALLLPPVELLALPISVWFAFVYWKHERDRVRGSGWVWGHGETSWSEDALQFSREMAEASKSVPVSSWRWAQAAVAAVKRWREGGGVSPSVEVVAEAPKVQGEEPKLVAVATAMPPKPPRKTRAAQPVPQSAQGELGLTTELPRAQTLAFRKRQAESPEGQMGRVQMDRLNTSIESESSVNESC